MLGLSLSLTDVTARQRFAAAGPSPSYEPEASALFARMTTTPPDATLKDQINTLIAGLKADGFTLATDLPLFYMPWLQDEQAALLNWFSTSFNATNPGAQPFTPGVGFVKGAALALVSASPNAVGVSTINQCLGVFTSTGTATAANDAFIASSAANVEASIAPRVRMNAAAFVTVTPAGNAPHHIIGQRASTVSQEGYRNGGSKTTSTTASGGTTSSSAFQFNATDRSVGVFHYGPALTDTKIAALYARLETFRIARGA